ncbi:methyltransferase domain-containing protein [Microcoleus sp. FACHB-831]|uniref:class I SAM-dependent methyltransferase n=1 Tax=Microcoleus sp. FACHB-831 TaxID=2692827 RepID=UPI00168993D8|nr:methyltransferase domain-containing protein [Microcoleus sp. FACHB-831]MBD1923534.1 methyltransferase domain-containing protein [Microcoleus sp. FACHB-831]
MMIDKLKLESVSCGVCGTDNWRKYASGKDYEYHTSEDEFQMVECQNCGNIYLNPRPVKEELPTIYPANYYAYNYDQAINPVAIRAKDWLDSIKVKSWLKYLKSSEPRFLDVGCGNGRYLKMLHRLGVPKEQLYGVEMSQEQIAQLNAEGFQGYYGRIEDVEAELPSKSFDLIVLLQVLEHVEQPRLVIKSLACLLKKDGILIIETPNTKSLDVKLFHKSYWGGYHFPRHWNLFNLETLKRLFSEENINIKAVNFLPAHSFWIFSFHHFIEHKWCLPWLARFFNPLQNIFLLSLFTALDMVRAKLGFNTSNIQIIAVK